MIKAVKLNLLLIICGIFLISACSNDSSNSSSGGEVSNITYTVSFNGNGAESGSIDSINAKYNQQILLPDNTFVKSGCRFTGWAESAGGEVKYLNQSYIEVTKHITLYAVWEKIESTVTSYKVTLSSGYNDKVEEYIVEFDKPFTFPENLFQRTGYVFTGWALNKDGEVCYKNNDTVVINNDIILYAVWQEESAVVEKYQITFNGSGAESGSMQEVEAEMGQKIILPANQFVKKDSVFLGWADTLNGEVKYKDEAEIQVTGNMTLYAVWQYNGDVSYYTVTLYGENGDSKPLTYKVEKGSQFPLPFTPFIKAGSYFEGWSETSQGTKKYNDQDIITVNSNIELYALWHARDTAAQYYYITLDANNGTGEKYETSTVNGGVCYLIFNYYKKDGYVFLGWSENPNAYEAAYYDGESFTPLKDMTLYAVWVKENDAYTVNFNINGGNEFFKDPETLSTRKGSYIVLPSLENFKHPSFVSIGYSENKDSAENYLTEGSKYYPDKNTTLYLAWGDGSEKSFASSKQWIYGIDIKDADWVPVSPYDPGIVLWEAGKSNWYDIYQHYNELCWAASSSNMFLWWYNINKTYVDRYMQENGYNGPAFTYDGQGFSPIYQYYKDNWEDIGNNPVIALHWFLQGSSLRPGGGFFADVYTNKSYTRTYVDMQKGHFNQILTDVIKNQKAALLQITTTGTHVVTFWGAEYDEYGFIKKVFITDSATKNTQINGKWGDLTTADIEYREDGKPYIIYNGYPASVVEKIYIFSLGIDIWKEYYNEK